MRPLDVLRSWAVQDSPPGAAIAAVVARAPDTPVGWLDEAPVVALYNPRTATAIVPADEVAAFGTAFLPDDDAGAEGDRRLGAARPTTRASRSRSQLAVDAISDALDGSELSRDDLHEQLRQRLPGELLPWCEGCQSHHARRGLLVMAGAHGRLCISGRAGRQPAFARTDQLRRLGRAGRERRRAPSSCAATARTYGAVDAGALRRLGGPRQGARARAVGARPTTRPRRTRLDGVRAARARRPGPARPRPRGAAARPGGAQEGLGGARAGWAIVLADGEPVALWRGAQEGQEARGVRRGAREAAAQARDRGAAERLAPHRGCTSVAVSFP